MTLSSTSIIAGIVVAVIAGVAFAGTVTTSALELTGHQLFANGTGLAYFDDGTAQSFKHMIIAAAGYYYDNSTIFYTGEIPGIPQAEGIQCGSKVNNTRGDSVLITLIRGADLIQNKSKAIEPSPVVRINVGDTVTWVNKDYVIHTITSPPGPGVPPFDDLPIGTNFEDTMSENESFRCTFTEPGGFHYGIGFNSVIKGAIIVEER
jgi:plastocyanin